MKLICLLILISCSMACQFERVEVLEEGQLSSASPTGPSVTDDGCLLKCDAVGKNCGEIDNKCDGLVQCGTCAADETCGGAGVENVCCSPSTCAELSADCGTIGDGCGGTIECGTCGDGESCGAGGVNLCGLGECVPTTCADLSADCGTINDGCGNVVDCGVCSGIDTCGGSGQPNVCGTTEVVIPSDLVTGCLGWPNQNFSQQNQTNPRIGLRAGDEAIDFSLDDINGNTVTLSTLLQTKPVFIQLGSYTCPVYQNHINPSNTLAADYGEFVHFVDVYTMEAHPQGDPSPYRGTVWEQEFSDYPQPTTYAERVSVASNVSGLHANKTLLIDALEANNTNPVWCTYGTAPNAAFLIDQDGVVSAAQPWIDERSMRTAIEAVLND